MNTTWHPGKATVSAFTLAVVTALPFPSRADNPIVQTSYTADPAPMVHDGRLYLYTSHDEDVTVGDFFTMNDWRLYSTTDMVNWTDHGTVAGYKTFSWGLCDAWAPQAIARNGNYYLYVPLNNSKGSKIGVGVSKDPAGPFKDPLGKALISTGGGNIDPTVFIDDDGQAHMYWGNPDLWYVKLNEDMISYSGSPIKMTAPRGYEEGPWFYKRGSLYYLVYPSDGIPEKMSYATSSKPGGPWTYRGEIMPAQSGMGSSFTNHPGVVDYKGHSYFFYHNAALPGGNGYKRSVCVEEFTYGADGSIPAIKMTKTGPVAVATLNPFQQVEAETIAFSVGLKTEVCTDSGLGMNVTAISSGDYLKVRDVDFLDGVISFEARVSSASGNAKIELHLDSEAGTLLGTCDVSGASSWTTKTCPVSGASGKHDLFLKFTGGSGELFKFNWWKFSGKTTPGSGGGGAGGAGSVSGTSGVQGLGGNSHSTEPTTLVSGGNTNGFVSTNSPGGAAWTGSGTGLTRNAGGNGGSTLLRNGGGGIGLHSTTPGFGTSTDSGAVESSAPSEGCSCQMGTSRGHSAAWLSSAIATLALRRRRRGYGPRSTSTCDGE